MLPPDFRWCRHLVGGRDYGDLTLKIGGEAGMEVAIVRKRVDGDLWLSQVRRYAHPQPHAVTKSRDRAIVWASRWAAANEAAVRAAAAEYDRRNKLTPYR